MKYYLIWRPERKKWNVYALFTEGWEWCMQVNTIEDFQTRAELVKHWSLT